MAGIYIHIPYCRHKCHYCNFFSLASVKHRDRFLSVLMKEFELRKSELGNEPVETVYFGGGTPSVFYPNELLALLQAFFHREDAETQRNAEITLELNPEDVDEAWVSALKDTSFNRFSLGVQSFSEDELRFLNRPHTAEQSLRAVHLLKEAGFTNISIDLIFGIPGSGDAVWEENLEKAFSLDVPHISAYALTVEEKTPLAWMIGHGRAAPVDEALQANQFRLMMRKMKERGFEQYEISNFSKPGWHAVHNTNYWKGLSYLGLGPSAHSYNKTSRRWNVANLSEYIEGVERGEPAFGEEILTPVQQYNEYVMTSLRTMWGCDSRKIESDFGSHMSHYFMRSADWYVEKGWLSEENGIYCLTEEGKLFADGIAAELFQIAK